MGGKGGGGNDFEEERFRGTTVHVGTISIIATSNSSKDTSIHWNGCYWYGESMNR